MYTLCCIIMGALLFPLVPLAYNMRSLQNFTHVYMSKYYVFMEILVEIDTLVQEIQAFENDVQKNTRTIASELSLINTSKTPLFS